MDTFEAETVGNSVALEIDVLPPGTGPLAVCARSSKLRGSFVSPLADTGPCTCAVFGLESSPGKPPGPGPGVALRAFEAPTRLGS